MRLIYLALGWCAGIVLANNPNLRFPALWLGLSAMALFLAWRFRRVEAAALLLLTLGGLRLSTIPTTSEIAAYNDQGGLTITGVIAAEPDRRDDGVQLRVSVESVTRGGETLPTDGLILVEAPPLTDAHYGDQIAATGTLITPGIADRFSYADYLARSGIFSILSNASVEVQQRGSGFFAWLFGVKDQANAAINHALPEPQAGLLAGILLGNQRGLAPDMSDAFATTGASHVIAISGFNMAVLGGVVIGALKRLRVRPAYAALIAIGVMGLYTLFVGANASVARAALMSGLLVVGEAIRRRTYLPASLAFAALILSLLNPLVLWDVSFQLSFFATLGLAIFAEPLSKRFNAGLDSLFSERIARWISAVLAEPLIVSLAALIFTLPLTMLYFGQVSPVILLVNLLIEPVQAALLLIGGAATLIAFVSSLIAQIFYWFDLLPLAWTIGIVRLFAQVPAYPVSIPPNGVAAFFGIVIGVAMVQAVEPNWIARFRQMIKARALLTATLIAGFALLILIGGLIVSRPDGLLHVWMLNAGGSDAVLIQTPRGAHLLVDGGNSPSRLLTALGDRLPFTNQTIDLLFITQPDEHRFGALIPALDRYDFGVAITNGWQNSTSRSIQSGSDASQPSPPPINLGETFAKLQIALGKAPVVPATAGYSITVDDGVIIKVLNPQKPPQLGDSLDKNALVLLLHYGEVSFLFTSDLNQAGQEALLNTGVPLHATVLQLPQGGIRYSLSPTFLEAVQPDVAVLQSYATNSSLSPDSDIISMLGDTPLFRTDKDGTIHLWTDGHELQINRER
jgi:competence protein ComEC